jgi:hypothetical protein
MSLVNGALNMCLSILPMAMSISQFRFRTSLSYWELTFFTRIHPPPPPKIIIGVYHLLGKKGHEVTQAAFNVNVEKWRLNDFFIGCDSDVSCSSGKPGPCLAILNTPPPQKWRLGVVYGEAHTTSEPFKICNPADCCL